MFKQISFVLRIVLLVLSGKCFKGFFSYL